MPMPRPQFNLKMLLVAMLVVAAFFGGMSVQRRLDEPVMGTMPMIGGNGLTHTHTFLELPDGSRWWDYDPIED